MPKKLPVYDLHAFGKDGPANDLYANHLGLHVKEHAFTNLPHKHDFYLTILVTKGSGWHEIDFKKYPVKPGRLFLMQPGQMHYWKLSGDIDGFVFFHSKAFYDEGFTAAKLKYFPFFRSFQSNPVVSLSPGRTTQLKELMAEIYGTYKSNDQYRLQKLHALVSLAYIEISGNYVKRGEAKNQTYLFKAQEFENLIETHFRDIRSAGEYADRLNISEKHLNRITRQCLNKTSTQLIAERIVLEAKRMLIHSGLNIAQTGYALGYSDKSYFTRFFKKNAGETPLAFLKRYKMGA